MNVVGVGGDAFFGDGHGFLPRRCFFDKIKVAQGLMRRADISEQTGAKILADSPLRLATFKDA